MEKCDIIKQLAKQLAFPPGAGRPYSSRPYLVPYKPSGSPLTPEQIAYADRSLTHGLKHMRASRASHD